MSAPKVNQEYLAQRQLKRGTAGWILLAGLGVSYVISGDFAGWNFGLAEAGWGGFAIAAVLMAIMYFWSRSHDLIRCSTYHPAWQNS